MSQIISGGNALVSANLVLSKARVGDKMKVADLGCGSSGHYIFPAAKMVGKNGLVYAVDILKVVLEGINRRIRQDNFKNIKTVWSDLEIFGATKIESGSLDVVMLNNTLYLSHKRAEMLREAVRMLKKEGKLLVVEWKNIFSPFGPPSEERVQIDLLKNAAAKLGLKLEEEFEAGQFHYGLIFTKM
jgi:ubiquinone/menaquinone biosynthesis C-methylase UbiE